MGLRRIAIGTMVTLVSLAAAPDREPAFEVATIKPATPELGFGFQINGRYLKSPSSSLSNLVAFAYQLHPRQITGGPAWLETEKYSLLAEAPAEGKPDMMAMLRTLLADRFQLKFHRAEKELSVYAIVPRKTGPKLGDHAGDPNGSPTYGFRALGTMEVNNAGIADFAGWMQRYIMDRPVIDRTGLDRRYTFNLTWKPDETQFPDLASQLPSEAGIAERPDLYTAIQQQLGLKLESTRAAVGIMVIDHVERPSAN